MLAAVASRAMQLRTRIGDVLCHPIIGDAIAGVFRGRVPSLRFGTRLETHASCVTGKVAALIFWGMYESAEIRFVRRYLAPELDVIELGGSIGAVTSEIARRQAPGHQLISVEANPELIPLLRRNVDANAPGHPVRILHRALDYAGGGAPTRFARGVTNMDGATGGGADAGAVVEVPSCTLSGLLDEHGIREFALVSDVEGAEAGLIRHDAAALARCRQIVIELHEVDGEHGRESPDSLRDALVERHGFRLVDQRGPVCAFERRS